MSRDALLRRLGEHSRELAELGVRSLRLFGSASRDEARADSDFDFVVEFEGPSSFDRYVELLFFLEGMLGRRVDLLTTRSVPPFMRDTIEREALSVPGLQGPRDAV